MSFESEFEEIKEECRRGLAEAKKLDANFIGRDGPGSVKLREVTQTYNRKLMELKKKYGLAERD